MMDIVCHHVSSASSLCGRCFVVLDGHGGWVCCDWGFNSMKV